MHALTPDQIKKAAGFTLIELLVVISIIAILASISVPVIGRALEAAKRAQAMAEINTLETGIRAYYNEYGRFPHGSGGPDRVYSDSNQELLNVLRARDGIGNVSHERNPRRIVFMEAPERSLGGDSANPDFIDPWEQPYRVAIDTNFDNDVNTASEHGIIENRIMAVWSLGSKPDEPEEHLKSWN